MLERSLGADANIVETVAHMMSAKRWFPAVDVICDIGGQDIKVLFMKNGDIQNFKLSNSCSAGNGMLLQAMADQFGIPVTEYAENAFKAELAPKFSYGCAVFLDSDRVNFQKEGYAKEELLAASLERRLLVTPITTIADVLDASKPRPDRFDPVGQKNQYAVRFADNMAARIAAARASVTSARLGNPVSRSWLARCASSAWAWRRRNSSGFSSRSAAAAPEPGLDTGPRRAG